jgi:hypothetical protein
MTFKHKLKHRFHRSLIGNVLEGCRIKQTYAGWPGKHKAKTDPNAIKQLTVKTLAQKYGIRVFIETGTFLGDMVAAVTSDFDRIYSIELSEDLFNRAVKKFAGYNHVTILQGDSFQVLPEILRHIDAPCLFWLGGHYSSGNTEKEKREAAILEELKQVFNHPIKNHVILIDDAHLFAGKNDSPTLEFLRTCVETRLSYYKFDVRNDIIRIYKKL